MREELNKTFGLDELAQYDANQAEFYRKIFAELYKLPIDGIEHQPAEKLPDFIKSYIIKK